MQIPIVNGIYTDNDSDFRTSYPRNLIPVAKNNGISSGYLRPSPGIIQFGVSEGPGIDRGSINWNGVCYRVMGTKLVRVTSTGSFIIVGDVGGTGQVTMDYGPTYLSIASDKKLFLYNGSVLQQVTDADLGIVLDQLWVDGYFMTTDGQYLVVTDINDPFSVNPLKYGSSEADPDKIKALLIIKHEVYVLNRHTIEVFDNIGGSGFPFSRIEGAQIEKGTLGTHTCCVFDESVAFLGSGSNNGKSEGVSVYIGLNGRDIPISTSEIDKILNSYSESELSKSVVESKVGEGQRQLLIHLPDQTLGYDPKVSKEIGSPAWFTLTSSILDKGKYRAVNHTWCYGKWITGDTISNKLGELVDHTSTHFGDVIGWEFGTNIIYNEGKGVLFNSIELVALTGRTKLGKDPVIWSQYSLDGKTWSMPRSIKAGRIGQRNKRLVWRPVGMMDNFRVQRFRGTSDSHLSFARLEADLEPLNV